jgi:hypothetical protein
LSPILIAQIAAAITKLPSNNKQDKLKPKSTPSYLKNLNPFPIMQQTKSPHLKVTEEHLKKMKMIQKTKKLPKGKKGQEKPNPYYYVNPHMSKSNKINSTKHNRFHYNYLTQKNKNPKSKIEQILFKIHKQFQRKNNIKHTPSPHKTKLVIYCIYSNYYNINKLYVGKTSHTAYV